VQQPRGAQALLHRLHPHRRTADAPVRRHHEAPLPGAWRQRPLHRL
jgi:hypothetical protein